MMQAKPRRAVAVRTVDGEVIPVLTLYDYDLPGQVQDELYEENGKTYLRKNIVEMTLPVYEAGSVNWYFEGNDTNFMANYFKDAAEKDFYNVHYTDRNTYYHIVPENALTYRADWNSSPMPGRDIRIVGNSSFYFRVGVSNSAYTNEELAAALSNARLRIAPDIEEQIKTYEVEEIIYG